MKILKSLLFLSLFSLSMGILWYFIPQKISKLSLISPVPPFLSIPMNKEAYTLDLWLPKPAYANTTPPFADGLSAKSVLSYDLTTDQILFSKNPTMKLPMASLTKVMTAIVALEHKKSDDMYIVPKEALVGEDSMGLQAGETLQLTDLLYGLVLNSGNDAAETIAANFPGGREKFIHAMNDKAASLGLTDTHFTNPTGLEGDGNQYTTVYDLLVITRYALTQFPVFDTIAATVSYTIPRTAKHQEYDLENETNLLTTYTGVAGIKTGYTPEAGLCLITYLNYDDHKILVVLLGSDNRRKEMVQVLDYSLQALSITPPPHVEY